MRKENISLILLATIPSLILCFISYYNFPIITLGVYDDRFVKAAEQILNKGYYDNIYYLPLYPYTLSLIFKIFGTNFLYPIILNAFFHGLTCFFLAKIAKIFDKKWFYPTLIIASIWPHLIWRTTYIYSESLFTLLIVLSIYLLLAFVDKKKIHFLVLSSIFFGLSLITKSSNIICFYILPLFLILFFYKKVNKNIFSSLKLATIFFLISFTIMSLQILRVYKETGHIGYNYQTGGFVLNYTYPCLSTKFGCGAKNKEAVDKVITSFYAKFGWLDDGMKHYLKSRGIELKDYKESPEINPYIFNKMQKDHAVELIKELDFLQVVPPIIGGYLKMFFHNFSYEVFQRLYIGTYHISDFSGNLFEKIFLFLKKIFNEAHFMFFWIISQIFLIITRVIQCFGLYYFFNLRKKIYQSSLLLIFFLPLVLPGLALGIMRYRTPIEPLLIILTIGGLFFFRNHYLIKKIFSKKSL